MVRRVPSDRNAARVGVLRGQRSAGNRSIASALTGRRVLQRQPWLATTQRWIDLNTEIQSLLNQATANQTRLPAHTRRSGWTFLNVIQSLLSEAQAQTGGALPALHAVAIGPQAQITPAQLAALVAAHSQGIRDTLTTCLTFDEGWNARAFIQPLMTRVGWVPPHAPGGDGAIPAAPAAANIARATALLAQCHASAGIANNDPYIRWTHICNRHLAEDMHASGFVEVNAHANGFFPLNWTRATVDTHIKLALQTPELHRALAHAITADMHWATTTVFVGGMAFTIGIQRAGAANWALPTARAYVNQFFPKTLPNIPQNAIQAWQHANPHGTPGQWLAWLRGTYQQPDN